MTTFVEPMLYLCSFGYGLGSMIGNVESNGIVLSYRQFVFAGVVAQSCLFQGFFEAAYGSFVRMYYQRIFKAMASTPITLSEVLWGELIWDASKGTLSATAVLALGVFIGDFSVLGSLMCIPLCFLGALLFSSLGLWMAALSKTIEEISYPQYLIVFPMFLFCGVYFPLENLPRNIQIFASLLPLTAPLMCASRRPWCLGYLRCTVDPFDGAIVVENLHAFPCDPLPDVCEFRQRWRKHVAGGAVIGHRRPPA